MKKTSLLKGRQKTLWLPSGRTMGWGLVTFWTAWIFSRYFDLKDGLGPFASISTLFSLKRFGTSGWIQHLGVEAQILASLGISFLALLNSWWLGSVVGDWLGLSKAKGPVRVFFELALGALVSSLFWMGTGLLRLWYPPLLIILGILATLCACGKIRQRGVDLPSIGRPQGLWEAALLGIALIYLLGGFLQTVPPETFYDALNYFLGIPHYWILKHGLVDDPGHILASYFHGGTLYFLNGFYFGGTEAAKTLSFASVLGCALFAGVWAGEEAGSRARGTVFALVLTFPLLFLNGWATRVDGLSTFCQLLFFYAFRRFWTESRPEIFKPWGITAALLAGFAVTVKPTAFIGTAVLFLFSLTEPRKIMAKGFRIWIWMALVGAFLTLPWFLKNACFTGNPFFPYGIHWMGGRIFSDYGYQRLLAENQQFLPLGTSLKNWLTFPWRLLMPSGGGGAQFVGPLILSFMPLSLPALAREGAPRFWAGTALVYLGLGLCFSHMLRFVMLAFVLLLMAWTVWAARAKGPWEKSVTVWGLLGALLAPPYFLAISARYFDGIGFLTGAESRVQYLERMVRNPYEDLARWTDTHLPSNARLLLVGDTRGLYYQRDFLANSAFEEPFLAAIARTSASPAQMAEKVRRLGVTDAVVNIPEGIRLGEDYHLYRLSPVQWARLNRYLALYWKPLYFNHFHAVYEIEDEPQKSPGPSVAPMNPFSFFAQPAYDFSRAAQAKRGSAVLAAVRAETALFPEDPFWVQKRAWAEKAFGVRSKKRG